jgi:hypothetical protein
MEAKITGLGWLDMEKVIPLSSKVKSPTVKSITDLSPDTIKRRYAKKVRRLSPGRVGMTVRDALEIASGESSD